MRKLFAGLLFLFAFAVFCSAAFAQSNAEQSRLRGSLSNEEKIAQQTNSKGFSHSAAYTQIKIKRRREQVSPNLITGSVSQKATKSSKMESEEETTSDSDEPQDNDADDEEDEDQDGDSDEDNEDENDASKSEALNFAANLKGSIVSDSNVEEDATANSATYRQFEAGIDASYQDDDLTLNSTGTFVFNDYRTADQFRRWRSSLSIDAEKNLKNGLYGMIGWQFEQDALLGDEQTISNEISLGVMHKSRLAKISASGRLGYEIISGSPASTNIGEAESREDTQVSGGELELQLRPDTKLSPFLRIALENVTKPGQDLAVENLDAFGTAINLGFRFKPNEEFMLDLSARFEERLFSDNRLRDQDTSFIELDLQWSPVETLNISGSVNRRLDDPSTGDTAVTETDTYKVELDWEATKETNLTLSATRELGRELGATQTSDDKTFASTLSHGFTDRFGVFVALEHLTSQTFENGSQTEQFGRTQVQAGIEIKM